jgi:hypothetical protein
MADTKTSDETAATTPTGAELVRIVQSATSKKTTAAVLGHQFRGCRLERTTNHTAQDFDPGAVITFQQATLDTDGFWSAGTPTRATIPASKGFKVANVSATVRIDQSTTNTYNNLVLVHRNSAGTAQRTAAMSTEIDGTNAETRYLNATMLCCPLADGDYFDASLFQETVASVDLNLTGVSLSVQIIGMEPV